MIKLDEEKGDIHITLDALKTDMPDLAGEYETKTKLIHKLETNIHDAVDTIKDSDTKITLEFADKRARLERELEQLSCECENKNKDMASVRQRNIVQEIEKDLKGHHESLHDTSKIMLQKGKSINTLTSDGKTFYLLNSLQFCLHWTS